MRMALTILATSMLAASCAADFVRDRIGFGGMSGGGVARAGRAMQTEGRFSWQYSNWIEVGTDLTLTVDSVFARIRAGDKDIASAMQHVVQAGVDMLGSTYSLVFSGLKVKPDNTTRSFGITEGQQPWSEAQYSKSSPSTSPVMTILSDLPIGTPVRWRSQMLTSQLAFNSAAPRRIFLRAEIVLEAQYRRTPDGPWLPAPLEPAAVNAFSDRLRRDLNQTYRRYLWDTLGLTVTTQQYGDGQ